MSAPENRTPAAQAFYDALDAYKAHGEKSEELKIDLAIAERSGDEATIEAAKAAKAEHDKPWHELYKARKVTLAAALESVGIDPEDTAYVL